MDFTITSERFSDEVSGIDIYVWSNIPQSALSEGKERWKSEAFEHERSNINTAGKANIPKNNKNYRQSSLTRVTGRSGPFTKACEEEPRISAALTTEIEAGSCKTFVKREKDNRC